MSGRHRRERRRHVERPTAADSGSPIANGLTFDAAPSSDAELSRQGVPVSINGPDRRDAAMSREVDELLAALSSLRVARVELDHRQEQLVAAVLRSGVSWGRLGEALGITRQAAHKRYSSR